MGSSRSSFFCMWPALKPDTSLLLIFCFCLQEVVKCTQADSHILDEGRVSFPSGWVLTFWV